MLRTKAVLPKESWISHSKVISYVQDDLLKTNAALKSTTILFRLRGPLHPPLRLDIQVVRPDQLEVWIIFDRTVLCQGELVAPDEFGQEDLYLLQSKVESNAHTWACGEWDV